MAESDPRQKQFDVLYGTLVNLQNGILSSTTQVAGFLLLAIGWITTSESALRLLHQHPASARLATVALAGTFGLYAFGAYLVYVRSQNALKMLRHLDLMPSACYEGNSLSLPELIVFIGGIFCLFALAGGLLLGSS